MREAEAVLRPVEMLDLKRLERTFTLRNRDGFVENFGPALIARVHEQAPSVRLLFVPKLDRWPIDHALEPLPIRRTAGYADASGTSARRHQTHPMKHPVTSADARFPQGKPSSCRDRPPRTANAVIMLGDLVAGRQPYPGVIRDVLEGLVQVLVPERLADDERVQGEGHDSAAVR